MINNLQFFNVIKVAANLQSYYDRKTLFSEGSNSRAYSGIHIYYGPRIGIDIQSAFIR